MQVTRLRPLSAGEVIDVAVKVYRTFFGALIRPAAVLLLPAAVLYGAVFTSLGSGGALTTTTTNPLTGQQVVNVHWGAFWTLIGALAVVLVVNQILLWITQATCVLTVAEGYLGGRPDWRRSLRFAWRRIGSVILVVIVVGVLSSLALLAFIVPGVYLYISWFVAVPIVLVEGSRGLKALGRSRQLVRGRWWPTFLTVLLMTVIVGVVGGVFRTVVTLVFGGLFGHGNLSQGVAEAIGYAFTEVILFPFQVCVTLVIYFDLRVRKEGFDLQLLATEVGSDWSGGTPSFVPLSGYPPAGQPPGWMPPAGWSPPPAPPGAWGGAPGWGSQPGWPPPPGYGAPPPGYGAPPPPAPGYGAPPPSPPGGAGRGAAPAWPALSPKPAPVSRHAPGWPAAGGGGGDAPPNDAGAGTGDPPAGEAGGPGAGGDPGAGAGGGAGADAGGDPPADA